jgi:hypothetical protein
MLRGKLRKLAPIFALILIVSMAVTGCTGKTEPAGESPAASGESPAAASGESRRPPAIRERRTNPTT